MPRFYCGRTSLAHVGAAAILDWRAHAAAGRITFGHAASTWRGDERAVVELDRAPEPARTPEESALMAPDDIDRELKLTI